MSDEYTTLYKQIIQSKDELELNYVMCIMNKLKSNEISVKSMVKSPENQKISKSVHIFLEFGDPLHRIVCKMLKRRMDILKTDIHMYISYFL